MDQYQLYKGGDGDFWWKFVSANGREIFRSSEGYNNRLDAIRSIEMARASHSAQRIEQYVDGRWFEFG